MNREEILTGVIECIQTVLDSDGATIRPEDKLIDDLGADSLDLLDLSFHLQQKFDVTISPKGMENFTKEKLGDKPYEVDGILTSEALQALRTEMPEVPEEEFLEGTPVGDLSRKFRVISMANYVEKLISQKGSENC